MKKVDYNVPDLSALLRATEKNCFMPVKEESGWRVIINDRWVCKKAMPGTPKRVYASRDAAKSRTEEEFSSSFYSAHRTANKPAYDACYHYVKKPDPFYRDRLVERCECKDSETVDALDRARVREFRKWMNSLYETGVVKYVEVK